MNTGETVSTPTTSNPISTDDPISALLNAVSDRHKAIEKVRLGLALSHAQAATEKLLALYTPGTPKSTLWTW